MASQTITGQDLQYTQDNKRCFAYSGPHDVKQADPELQFLLFTTSSSFIEARFQMFSEESAADDIRYTVDFNDIQVARVITGQDAQYNSTMMGAGMFLIIPPFTKVSVTAYNKSSTSGRTSYVNMTGRVYEHLPVRN